MWNQKASDRGNSRSVIRELFAYGQALRETAGEQAVADLSLGNPATPPPAAVTEAFRELLATADPLTLHGYTAAEGDPWVRASIAASLSRRFATGIGAEHLFLTAGAAPALTAVFFALTEAPGDEFIALAPFFPEYSVFTNVAGGVLRVCPCDPVTLLPDLDALAALIGERTRAVIVNSPNNPSGVVYDRETLSGLADCLTARSREIGHTVYLVSDEPYRELVYDGREVPYLPSLYPETVICYSYSKSFSLPGDRIGYVLVPPTCGEAGGLLRAVAGAARTLGHVCAPALMQRVVGAVPDAAPDIAFYDRNRQALMQGLAALGYSFVIPEGAFYLLVRVPDGDAPRFSEQAKQLGLLVVPCDGFGLAGYVRLAYCVAPEVIDRALQQFMKISCKNCNGCADGRHFW